MGMQSWELSPKLQVDSMDEPNPSSGGGEEKPPSQIQNAERDREWVRRVQAGEAEAFDLLVEAHKRQVYGIIYNMLGNHDDAADLSQEAFVKAFKHISSFRSEASFSTWLCRIAVNTTLNFIKRRKEATVSLDAWDPQIEEEPVFKALVSRSSVHRELDREELQEKLNEALQKLSEEHRAVVVLHDIEGLRHQEVAKILSCSEATARSRLYYAHQQLQAFLANYL